MPAFTLTATAAAPPEEVWKLLFDPTRIPEWWAGIGTARLDGAGAYTLWYDGLPDEPLPQRMRSDRRAGQVTMSCQINEIDFRWRLTEVGEGTRITLDVEIAPANAGRLDRTRELLSASLPALGALAEVPH